MELTRIIWLFMIGVGAATLMVFYNNRFLGKLVRALIAIDATSPETAISLEELDIKMTYFIRNALRPGTSFSETVMKTEDGRFYIAPDKVALAKSKYRSKDATIGFILMSIVIILVATLALTYIMPEAVDSFTKTIKGIFNLEG